MTDMEKHDYHGVENGSTENERKNIGNTDLLKKRWLPILLVGLLAVAIVGALIGMPAKSSGEKAPATDAPTVSEPVTVEEEPVTVEEVKIIAAKGGRGHIVALKSDGTVSAAGEKSSWAGAGAWTDIVQIAAGEYHTLGLKADGTVVAAGENSRGECNVSRWTDMVAVAAGYCHSVGLRSDGTVVAAGEHDSGQCDVAEWSGITAIAAGDGFTLGVREDGTVLLAGETTERREAELSGWRDIVTVSAVWNHVVGVKADGTAALIGNNSSNNLDVSGWTDVTDVASGAFHIVALRSDGTVLATGDNRHGECEVADWKNVVSVGAGYDYTVAVTADGTVLTAGENSKALNDMENLYAFHEETEPPTFPVREQLAQWTDIAAIEAYPFNAEPMFVGLKKDGDAVACGAYDEAAFNAIPRTGIKKLVLSRGHFLALYEDGTVFAAGNDEYGQCDVSQWRNVTDISAGNYWSAGVSAEGEFLFAGYGEYSPRVWMDNGFLEPSEDWSSLSRIVAGFDSLGAVSRNGTSLCFGFDNIAFEFDARKDEHRFYDVVDVSLGRDNLAELYSNGTVNVIGDNFYGQCHTSSWINVRKVAVGNGHTVGLLADGTVIATGNNDCGQCDVSGWKDIADIAVGPFCTVGVTKSGRVLFAGLEA